MLLVDRMTHMGGISSISRYTTKKEDSGPMGKASFEETLDNFLMAGIFCQEETTKGVSASIICGKKPHIGTGLCGLKMNLALLPVVEEEEKDEVENDSKEEKVGDENEKKDTDEEMERLLREEEEENEEENEEEENEEEENEEEENEEEENEEDLWNYEKEMEEEEKEEENEEEEDYAEKTEMNEADFECDIGSDAE